MPTTSLKRKVAPNDAPTLVLVVLLLIANAVFANAQSVLGAMLLGVVPVLGVVVFRQIPWCRVRGRWQLRSLMLTVVATLLSIGALYWVGYASWWLVIVFIHLFCLVLVGMQIHRWTSLLMSLCCALAGWLLL